MNAAELAAYIGAAAWLPQIAGWAYRKLSKPVVMIVPGDAEIGFTRFGPIFNARMAFTTDRKDAIIDGFQVVVKHADGETRTLRWIGLAEEFSEITDDAGNRSVVRRDQPPIALKIGTESLIEKFVRFQEPRYHDADRTVMAGLVTQFNFLKQSGDPDYVAKVLATKEFHDVLAGKQQAFWWRAGKYHVTFQLSSPRKISVPQCQFTFELAQLDVDDLRLNIKNVETDLNNVVKSNLPDYQIEPIKWSWATVKLERAG